MSANYMSTKTKTAAEYYGLLLIAGCGMVYMAAATELITAYISLELLSFSLYILVGYLKRDNLSSEASLKYILLGAFSSAMFLYGMSLVYGVTGTTTYSGIAEALSGRDSGTDPAVVVGFMLILAGVGFKVSAAPFHMWAPDAYEGAPMPVTAFLSTLSKAAGFALILRLFSTAIVVDAAEWRWAVITLAALTMTIGNLVAIQQTNVKRLLAYSSIAQAGYMLIGVVGLNLNGNSPFSGLNGVLIYLFAYLFTNLGAFICVIAIENATGITEIPQYAGLIKRAPYIAALFVFFFLSLAGIPPTAGFIGKFFVFASALRNGFLFLAAVGVINSVISIFYYFSVVRASFFQAPVDPTPIRISPVVTAALTVTAVMVLLIALYPDPVFNIASQSMAMLGVAAR
jgi:proton-translocating NADH-quinone oxidoreductase chain N